MSEYMKALQVNKGKRIIYIDDAKAIAIWLMIFAHFGLSTYLHNLIYSFHMPLFFMISGMFFNSDKTFKENLISSIKTLLIPYLSFQIINLSVCWIYPYLHPNLYYGMRGFNVFKAALVGIFLGRDVVTPSSFLPAFPLWFLISLFTIRILVALFSVFIKNKWFLALVLIIISIGLTFLVNVSYLSINSSLLALPFFVLGYLFKGFDFKKVKFRFILLACLVVYVIVLSPMNGRVGIDEHSYGKSIFCFYFNAVAGSLMVLNLTVITEKIIPGIVHYVGKNTIIVLGMSAFPMILFKIIIVLFGGYNYINSLIFAFPVSILIVLCCLPFIWLINKYVPFIVGKNKLA